MVAPGKMGRKPAPALEIFPPYQQGIEPERKRGVRDFVGIQIFPAIDVPWIEKFGRQ
jgi:hypothetical protein